jgi:hypothetical protein
VGVYVLIWLGRRERRLLADVVDMHVEGVAVAKDATTVDPTIETADRLLDLMSGYDEDLQVLTRIRQRIKGD